MKKKLFSGLLVFGVAMWMSASVAFAGVGYTSAEEACATAQANFSAYNRSDPACVEAFAIYGKKKPWYQ